MANTTAQRGAPPGAGRLVTSAMTSGDGLKYRFTFSGLRCLDLDMSVSRLAPA